VIKQKIVENKNRKIEIKHKILDTKEQDLVCFDSFYVRVSTVTAI